MYPAASEPHSHGTRNQSGIESCRPRRSAARLTLPTIQKTDTNAIAPARPPGRNSTKRTRQHSRVWLNREYISADLVVDIRRAVVHDSLVTEFPTGRVKFSPEYSCDMPLWCDEGDWEDLNLPADLVARLAAWQAEFDSNFRHDTGWLDAGVRESWTRESEVLVADLRSNLPPEVRLEVSLWPIAPKRPWWKFWEGKRVSS